MDINRLLGSFLGEGGLQQAAQQAAQQALGPIPGQVSSAIPQGVQQGITNNLGGFAGGAATGGLVGLMLGSKKARKIGGKAVKYGGMAAIGGLAYMAYKNYKAANQAPTSQATAPHTSVPQFNQVQSIPIQPAPVDSGFDPSEAQDATGADLRVALIKAMIHAAKSDGHIDAEENTKIRQQIAETDLAGDEKAFLFDQLDGPADPLAVASWAKDEAQGAELYLASLLAIDLDHADERRYLDRLGDALRLPEPLRQHIEVQLQSQVAG